MAQGDAQPGLLSKVAKFVTNPTKDWSELGQVEGDQDSGYSKETLKVMIERKRQNDFVRKREFDHLRKLRRREPSASLENGGRPSFFQSSLTSNMDERAETLKKIDEIEAQMSKQWWKGKQDPGGAARPSEYPASAATPSPVAPAKEGAPGDTNFDATVASALRPTSKWLDSGPQSSQSPPSSRSREMAPTIPAPLNMSRTQSRTANSASLPSQPPAPRKPVGAGFSTNRLFAVELADSLTDPDLEEAAIRFANGDDAGAEEGLLAALQGPTLRPESAEAWMSALFDLYRATGQQERFESVAIEFANRFGRSAPAWFSTPELLSQKSASKNKNRPMTGGGGGEPIWSSPSVLADGALRDLRAAMQSGGNGSAPMIIDWQALESIQPDAVPGLGSLFAGLCNANLQLVFHGYDSLNLALKHITPSGDRSVGVSVWQMRMDALRVMRLQDEFELVALEYCVTFEVSPPSWQAARCNCVLEGSALNSKLIAAEMEEDAKSGWGGSNSSMAAPVDGGEPAVVELAGEIVGDAAETLARLEAGMEGATRMVISCARLIRVDFSAAGSILNWVAVQQGQGCQVQFRDVNRIVAAFFNVIGINEHARVVPRNA